MLARIRFATRSLSKTPVVTLVVILSLALGIGANTAIFSLMYQMVLQSLPVERPEELMVLNSPGEFKSGRTSTSKPGGIDSVFSYRVYRELARNPGGLTGLAAFRTFGANLAFGNQTVSGSSMAVAGQYFPVLGIKPLLGRLVSPEDDVHGAGQPVAVLGYGYWKDRLGGQTSILNQPLRINGNLFTVVGVTPHTFTSTTLGEEPDVYVPLALKPRLTPGWDGTDKFSDYWLYVFGRLKPGVTPQQAEAALNTVYAGLVERQAKETTDRNAKYVQRFLQSRLSLKDGKQGQSNMRDESKIPIYTLMGAAVLVLLIAMANAANLLLARSAQRRKELAIRTALGASRTEIMSQMLTEACLLSFAGGAAGIVLGWWTLDLLLARIVASDSPAYWISTSLDWPVLLFSAGIAIVTGLIFGLYPAWDASCTTPGSTLKEAASQTTGGTGPARVRKALVCAQVMISAVLLIPTGLFLKSLVNILRVDLGIRTENVITFGVSPELNGYNPQQSRALFERMEQELAAIPGVSGVTAAMVPLIAGNNWGNNLTVEGFANGPEADTHSMFNIVGAGFFGKMGIPLAAGREFKDSDTQAAPKVAIVNETFAKHFFGNRNPIGRKLTPGWDPKVLPDIEIVGVVKDSKYSNVKQKTPRVYYTPWAQSKDIGELSFYVRTALSPSQMAPQIRRVMSSIDRDLPLEGLRTLEEQVARTIRQDRIVLQLAASFAAIATVLAMLGLYGVMAYSVTRRTREIGIRLALGAGTARIRSMVMRELLVILAAGLLLGVPAALALGRMTESQLFGVKAYDTSVVLGAVSALAAAAFLAAYLPARRATRVNPVEALRYE
jgi:putative ABC transport system permease protein